MRREIVSTAEGPGKIRGQAFDRDEDDVRRRTTGVARYALTVIRYRLDLAGGRIRTVGQGIALAELLAQMAAHRGIVAGRIKGIVVELVGKERMHEAGGTIAGEFGIDRIRCNVSPPAVLRQQREGGEQQAE